MEQLKDAVYPRQKAVALQECPDLVEAKALLDQLRQGGVAGKQGRL